MPVEKHLLEFSGVETPKMARNRIPATKGCPKFFYRHARIGQDDRLSSFVLLVIFVLFVVKSSVQAISRNNGRDPDFQNVYPACTVQRPTIRQ
jgi:hypothetical protein